jgi:thymidylate kinase
MGMDGSGKTTLGRRFQGALRSLGINVEYRKEFNYFLLRYVFGLLGKKRVDQSRRLFRIEGESSARKGYFRLWPYIVWLDLLLEHLWCRLFKRRSVIIMDRYAYDFLMSWKWLRCSSPRIIWLYAHFPKPHIGFILDASASVAYLRKKEDHDFALTYYRTQKRNYLNLSRILGIKVIDSTKAVEVCSKEIFAEFRKYFIAKFSEEDRFLLFFSSPTFSPRMLDELSLSFNPSDLNWDHIIDSAFKSNVENELCKNALSHYENQLPESTIRLLRRALSKSNERIALLSRSLKAVSEKLGSDGIDFLAVKTIAPFRYGATDIDILVHRKDFGKAHDSLLSTYSVSSRSKRHKAITFVNKKSLPLDLHCEISWIGRKVFDEEKLFSRKKKVTYDDLEVFVPVEEDELSILCAHSLFQHHYTTLGEFFWIMHLANGKIDLQEVVDSARCYGWERSIRSLLSQLAWRHNIIYDGRRSCLGEQTEQRSPRLLNTLVYFHGFGILPNRSPDQLLDLFLTLLRRVRFKFSHELAYNSNWFNARERSL